MKRMLLVVVAGVVALACVPLAEAADTGLSVDGGSPPGAPPPHIAPPGGGQSPRPKAGTTTPLAPRVGDPGAVGGLPPREVQPGEETPQADSSLGGGTVSGIRRRKGAGRDTGDDDDIDDTEVQRRTVQGVEVPGRPSSGGAASASGGDGTQTEDELYVGRKAGESPTGSSRTPPGLPAGPAKQAGRKPAASTLAEPRAVAPKPVVRGPGAVVVEEQNCGTAWTPWGSDPTANSNPCPFGCMRGERQVLDESKDDGGRKIYKARYHCKLPEMIVSQPPGVEALQAPGRSPLRNCGTMWTDLQDSPEADANPCPSHCVRGELQVVNRKRSDDRGVQYTMRYQCYVAPPGDPLPAPKVDKGARADPRRPAGADVLNRPAAGTPAISASERPTGGPGGIRVGEAAPADTGRRPGSIPASPPASPTPAISASELPTGGPGGIRVGEAASTDTGRRPGPNLASRPTAPTPDISSAERPTGGPGGVRVGTSPTPAGSSGAVATAPVLQGPSGRFADSGGAQIKTAQVEGAGTTLTAIGELTPTTLIAKWRPVAGASDYVVRALAKGLNHSVSSQPVRPSAHMNNELAGKLSGLLPGVEHRVWVDVRYADGRAGVSDERTITLPAAVNPQGFVATLTSPGTVRLEWQPVEDAAHYLVQGSQLPRQQTTATQLVVPNLPYGSHEWTVVAAFGPGIFDDTTPSRASAIYESREAMVERAFNAGQARYRDGGPDPARWKRLALATSMDYERLVDSFAALWVVTQAYQYLLERDATTQEAALYAGQLSGGRHWHQVWREIAHSAERDRRYGHWAPAPMDNLGQARVEFNMPTLNKAENCTGGIGDRCDTTIPGVTEQRWHTGFALPDGTRMAYVEVNVAVGSILHDNACLRRRDGLHCDGRAWDWFIDLNPNVAIAKALTPAALEWNKAVWNRVDGRIWRHSFGPYPVDAGLRTAMWYDDVRPVANRTAWMAPVVAIFTIPVHTERYTGGEVHGTRVLAAPPGASLDSKDSQFCRSGSFAKVESFIGKADWGICR